MTREDRSERSRDKRFFTHGEKKKTIGASCDFNLIAFNLIALQLHRPAARSRRIVNVKYGRILEKCARGRDFGALTCIHRVTLACVLPTICIYRETPAIPARIEADVKDNRRSQRTTRKGFEMRGSISRV